MYIATLFLTQGSVGDYWPFWVSWFVLFLIYEFNALRVRTKQEDKTETGATLSELVWNLIRGKAWYHHVLYATFLLFFIDLGFHFFTGTALY
jgi:hypothetical protein